MRDWNEPSGLALLSHVVDKLKNATLLDPDSLGSRSPLDLQGLTFPTVDQAKADALPENVVRILGHLEFDNATLRQINFSKAQLDFSVWNNCCFQDVCFDRAKLVQVRFFGCLFQNCTFRSSDLSDASFSIGRRGAETEFVSTLFEKTKFRGASCSNPVFRSTVFLDCKLDGFVFEGAFFDDVAFAGKYKELTFRGIPNEVDRNRLGIDLSSARLTWLNADHGIDLGSVVLPDDGSCLVLKDRVRAASVISTRLSQSALPVGRLVAKVLLSLFSDQGVSALELTQDTFLISKPMIADFAETNDAKLVDSLFDLIRSTARREGFLVA